MSFGGIKIVCDPCAESVTVHHIVAPWPIRKRRRGWRVCRVEDRKPGAFQIGGALHMHPSIYEQLKAQCATQHPGGGK